MSWLSPEMAVLNFSNLMEVFFLLKLKHTIIFRSALEKIKKSNNVF